MLLVHKHHFGITDNVAGACPYCLVQHEYQNLTNREMQLRALLGRPVEQACKARGSLPQMWFRSAVLPFAVLCERRLAHGSWCLWPFLCPFPRCLAYPQHLLAQAKARQIAASRSETQSQQRTQRGNATPRGHIQTSSPPVSCEVGAATANSGNTAAQGDQILSACMIHP